MISSSRTYFRFARRAPGSTPTGYASSTTTSGDRERHPDRLPEQAHVDGAAEQEAAPSSPSVTPRCPSGTGDAAHAVRRDERTGNTKNTSSHSSGPASNPTVPRRSCDACPVGGRPSRVVAALPRPGAPTQAARTSLQYCCRCRGAGCSLGVGVRLLEDRRIVERQRRRRRRRAPPRGPPRVRVAVVVVGEQELRRLRARPRVHVLVRVAVVLASRPSAPCRTPTRCGLPSAPCTGSSCPRRRRSRRCRATSTRPTPPPSGTRARSRRTGSRRSARGPSSR